MAKQRIVWRDPPPETTKYNGGEFLEFAVALRARPGQWAIMPTDGRTQLQCQRLAANIKRGSNSAFRPPSDFEIRQSKDVIYARYVGE